MKPLARFAPTFLVLALIGGCMGMALTAKGGELQGTHWTLRQQSQFTPARPTALDRDVVYVEERQEEDDERHSTQEYSSFLVAYRAIAFTHKLKDAFHPSYCNAPDRGSIFLIFCVFRL